MQKATYDVPNTISYAKRGFYDVSGCGYFLGASEFRRESKRAAPFEKSAFEKGMSIGYRMSRLGG